MSIFKRLSDAINPPKARIAVRTLMNEYHLGEEIKGEVWIISEEEFYVIQAVVWLTCCENIKKTRRIPAGAYTVEREEQYWDNATLFKTSFVVFGVAHITQGYNCKHSFALKIPSVARYTYYSVNNNVKWWMNFTLQIKGRPSIQTSMQEILVAKQQSSPLPPSPTILKEIVREVVLIPCAYCSGLMPQASIFCPNCGARRKG